MVNLNVTNHFQACYKYPIQFKIEMAKKKKNNSPEVQELVYLPDPTWGGKSTRQ